MTDKNEYVIQVGALDVLNDNDRIYPSDIHINMDRIMYGLTNRGSNGHGHDISTNGRGHKKVVTGKAGNRYPVPKRKGVR